MHDGLGLMRAMQGIGHPFERLGVPAAPYLKKNNWMLGHLAQLLLIPLGALRS